MSDWESFALLSGGASSALTGLLFVAVSLNRVAVTASPSLRAAPLRPWTFLIEPP